jgi:hypothetical protein
MDDKKKKPVDADIEGENEGEGSKSADRNYRNDVDDFLKNEDPSKLARQAASDVEREPGKYAEAEQEGKRRSAGDDAADKDLI